MILITGATGHVGEELVRALFAGGHPVRALAHTANWRGLPEEVERVVGDLDQPQTLSTALDGVQRVFLLSGYQDMPGLLAAMQRAGVKHVVLLTSGCVIGGSMSNAITRYHMLSETAVWESGIPWTILRPSGFMSNALQWVPQLRAGNVVRAPWGNVRVAVIDPADIAAVAAQVLTTDGHIGQSYRLTGPESLLPTDQVRVLATVLGRELRFEGQSDAEARAEMYRTTPAEYVEAFFRFFTDGEYDDSLVDPTVQTITRKPPRTFAQWAQAHAQAFQSERGSEKSSVKGESAK